MQGCQGLFAQDSFSQGEALLVGDGAVKPLFESFLLDLQGLV